MFVEPRESRPCGFSRPSIAAGKHFVIHVSVLVIIPVSKSCSRVCHLLWVVLGFCKCTWSNSCLCTQKSSGDLTNAGHSWIPSHYMAFPTPAQLVNCFWSWYFSIHARWHKGSFQWWNCSHARLVTRLEMMLTSVNIRAYRLKNPHSFISGIITRGWGFLC